MTIRKTIILLALFLSSCRAKHEEINSNQAGRPSNATISKVSTKEEQDRNPLPESDYTHESKPHIYLMKIHDQYILYDSVQLDTFHLSYKHHRIDVGLTSPTGKYIACGFLGEPSGDKISIRRLIILNAYSSRIIHSMGPPTDIYMILDKWISKSRLLFDVTDDFAMEGSYVFDAFRDSLQLVKYDYGR
jgi:hypothetical protein